MERKVMSHRRTLLLLVFMDHVGIGLVIPLIVPLMKELGAKQMQQGLISSIYGVLQLVGSPFMGLLSDREGRRAALLISYTGTAFGYLVLGFSTSLQVLMLSRLLTGLLKHSSNATRAYIADHTTRANRAVELGRMATASGLGMMIGPTMSGVLFKLGGYVLPATISSSLFFTNIAILLSCFPSEIPPSIMAASPVRAEPWYRSLFPKVSILWRPRVAALFAVRVILGLGVQTFRQGFSMLLLYRFNLGVQWNGLLMSYQGLLTSMVQGLAIKPLTNRFSDGALITRGIFALGAAYAAAGIVPNTALLAVALTPVALSSGVVRTTYTAVLTSAVSSNEVGQVLGLADAVMSICRILGPTLAGYFSQTYGPSSPALLSGVLVGTAGLAFILLGLSSPSLPFQPFQSFSSPHHRGETQASIDSLPYEESKPLLTGSRLESPALHRSTSHRHSKVPPGDQPLDIIERGDSFGEGPGSGHLASVSFEKGQSGLGTRAAGPVSFATGSERGLSTLGGLGSSSERVVGDFQRQGSGRGREGSGTSLL